MDMNELRLERISIFKNAVTGKETPLRVPHYGNFWSWKVLDAGYKLSDALYNYETYEKVLRHFADNYKMDLVSDLGIRNPLKVTNSLGNTEYKIDDDTGMIQVNDQCFMEADEYDQLIKDPRKFIWETVIPRKYPLLREKNNSAAFRTFLEYQRENSTWTARYRDIYRDEYGYPSTFAPTQPSPNNAFEMLFTRLRGIVGICRDIQKCPDKVLAAIDAMDEAFILPAFARAKSAPKGTNPNTCFDFTMGLLAHTILSPKQFEKFYWPALKRLMDYAEEYDKIGHIFSEGDSTRFYDFFQEFPKNRICVVVEMDDVFEMKKKLPHITVGGGMPALLLGTGTPDECVAYAKRLIDELGYDYHYVFAEDKMMSFHADCKAENLKAVCDYVFAHRY